jgi:serine-type D-Ala-D-Ala carboxypeptidase (penicillin-binding protein 5/6)
MTWLLRLAVAGLVVAVMAMMSPPGTSQANVFPPEIASPAAIIVDDQSGESLFEKNAHARRAPASITKIVTALVVLEHRRPGDLVRIRTEWTELEDSTLMGLFKGEYLTIEDLLYGLMLPSGNDAALELAREVGGSETNFVGLMNDKVAELGLVNTRFANPHGLDHPDHYTSAYDMTMLARYAMRNPVFAKIAGTKEIQFSGRWGYYPLRNLNRILFTYPGVDGVKNGFTDNALSTVVASLTRDGRRYFVTLLGCNHCPSEGGVLLDSFFDVYQPPKHDGSITTDDPIARRRPVPNEHYALPYRDWQLVPVIPNGQIPRGENLY